MAQTSKSDLIQLLSVNNIVPLLVMIVGMVVFTVNLNSRIDLVNQKLDLVLKYQTENMGVLTRKDEELDDKYAKMQGQWGELSQRVTRMER